MSTDDPIDEMMPPPDPAAEYIENGPNPERRGPEGGTAILLAVVMIAALALIGLLSLTSFFHGAGD